MIPTSVIKSVAWGYSLNLQVVSVWANYRQRAFRRSVRLKTVSAISDSAAVSGIYKSVHECVGHANTMDVASPMAKSSRFNSYIVCRLINDYCGVGQLVSPLGS